MNSLKSKELVIIPKRALEILPEHCSEGKILNLTEIFHLFIRHSINKLNMQLNFISLLEDYCNITSGLSY